MDFLRDPCSDQSFAMFDVPKVLVIHLNSCHFRCWISEICTHPTCIFAVFLLLLLPKIEKKGSSWIYHDLSPVGTTNVVSIDFNTHMICHNVVS